VVVYIARVRASAGLHVTRTTARVTEINKDNRPVQIITLATGIKETVETTLPTVEPSR